MRKTENKKGCLNRRDREFLNSRDRKRLKRSVSGCALVIAAAVLFSGCGGQKDKLEADADVSAAVTEEAAENTKSAEDQESEGAQKAADKQQYGVMYANVADVQNDEKGTAVYRLQDLNDPENIWTLNASDIGDIAADLEKGSQAAFLFSGDMEHDTDNVSFIAAVPYETYRLGQTEGMTLNNTMSTFTLKTNGGEELTFLKDNCKMEPGSLTKSEGDRILVYYAYGEQDQVYYPLEIFAAE